MASSFTGLGTELMTTGENAGTWGSTTNTNLQIIEQLAGGYEEQDIAGSADTTTLSVSDGSTGAVLGHRIIKFTGTITGNQIVTIPLDVQQMYIVVNGTSGAYTVQFKYVSGSGSSVTFSTTDKGTKLLYAAADHASNPNIVDTEIGTHAPSSADGAALGSASKEFSDLYLADGGVIYLGNDQEVTLTHVADAGLLLNSDNYLTFRDSALKIHSSADGQLDIDADTEVEIATTTLDLNGALDVSGASQFSSTITVGENDTGYDVKFFGATASAYMLWDESADDLVLAGAAGIDLAGDIDVDGTANLDAVDIDGAVQIDATFTSGVDGQGYDTKFFGDTSSAYMLWDTSADDLVFAGAAGIDLAGDIDVDGTANLDAVDIDGAVQIDNTVTVGENDTGYDVKFFGDTASAYMLWDTSTDDLVLAGAAGIDLAGDIDVDGTANLDAVDIDGAVQLDSTLTVGANDQGYDIKFFGDTASAYMLWDTSADDLVLAGAAGIDLAGDIDVDGTANLDNTDIDGTLAVDGTTISLDATTSLNIDNSNTSNGITIGTATSSVPISIGHATSEVTVNDNLTVTGDLTISGTTTTVSSTTVAIADSMLNLAKDQGTSSDAVDFGFYGTYGVGGTAKYAGIFRDLSATGDPFTFFDTLEAEPGTTVNTGGTGYDLADIAVGGATFADDIDVDGTANLDAVDIDGAVQLDSTFTVGVDDQGYDVKLFGDTASAYMLWDTSADDLILGGGAGLVVPEGQFTLGSTAVTSTATELNIVDGGTSATGTTLVNADRLVVNDNGTMVQVAISDVKTYLSSAGFSSEDPTALAIALG